MPYIPSSRIVTSKNGTKTLVKFDKIQSKIVKERVRDEDEYLNHIGHIIQRDFYPDLAKAKGELKSLNNTLFDPNNSARTFKSTSSSVKKGPEDTTLDHYLANNTTEDNASFMQIVEAQQRKHVEKISEFFRIREDYVSSAITEREARLAIEGPKQKKAIEPKKAQSDNLENHIIEHNAVHFIPDGVSLSKEELDEMRLSERKIDASNTRFKRPLNPINKKHYGKSSLSFKVPRYGPDGREIDDTDAEIPSVSGFRFVPASPSPSEVAGADATPLITWGELGQTPQRLDAFGDEFDHYLPYSDKSGSATPSASNKSSFKINEPSEREELAHKLADKAGKDRAKSKEEQLQRMREGILSPASRRILSGQSSTRSSLGLISPKTRLDSSSRNSSIRSSNSGSFRSRPGTGGGGISTPLLSPIIPRIIPKESAGTKKRRENEAKLRKMAKLTDGLLKL